MINPFLGTCEPGLKLWMVFSEIMQQAREPGGFTNTERFTEVLGTIGCIVQMLTEYLPVGPALVPSRMCVILQGKGPQGDRINMGGARASGGRPEGYHA